MLTPNKRFSGMQPAGLKSMSSVLISAAVQCLTGSPRPMHWEPANLWTLVCSQGYYARLHSEQSGFEPWPGTLCSVLGQDPLVSQCLSPRGKNGYPRNVGKPNIFVGEWPAMG